MLVSPVSVQGKTMHKHTNEHLLLLRQKNSITDMALAEFQLHLFVFIFNS